MLIFNKFVFVSTFLVPALINPSFGGTIRFLGNDTMERAPIVGIIGGEDAEEGEFPYQIAIVDKTGSIYCGGSLINTYFVLTAAHCFSRSFRSMRLIAGAINIAEPELTWQIRKISRFVKHPKYKARTTENDVAIISTKTPFVVNEFVQTISLYTDSEYPTGEAVATGWGEIDDGSYPSVLKKVTVTFVDYSDCLDSYTTLPENAVCAADLGKDTCQGDSGGPLVQDDLIVGITSFGEGCADPNFPGVYASVAAFNSWIQRTMLKLAPRSG